MSLGIQGWAGDWVSVVSKWLMGLFRRTLSPLSLAITKLRGKMGLKASPAIVPQCRKFRPPTPPTPNQRWKNGAFCSSGGFTHVVLLGYLQKTFHDESLQGLLHYGYQVLYREVYHAALEPPEAILLTQTI